jgi:N-acetylmuramoyl-L-alanine amidase
VGYQGPFFITSETTAYKIAGQKYKDLATVYFLPPGHVKTGEDITDFNDLPSGSRVYLPLDSLSPG